MFESFDGTPLHVVELGEGPPVVLVHGLFSCARINWVKYGAARQIADAGYRLILPDLRGHGESAATEDWPENALARDLEALVAHYRLEDYVLGGFSLGARTVARAIAGGLKPRAAILAGMGLGGILHASDRAGWFIRLIEGRGRWKRGDHEYLAAAFMEANVKQPDMLIPMLRQQQATTEAQLSGFDMPVLVLSGADDHDNGSAPDLAARLPQGVYREIPGTHMTSVTKTEFGREIVSFLEGLDA